MYDNAFKLLNSGMCWNNFSTLYTGKFHEKNFDSIYILVIFFSSKRECTRYKTKTL